MRVWTCSVALAAIVMAPSANSREATIADVLKVQQVSDPAIAPDGSAIVYALTTHDTEEDEQVSHIWTAAWDGSGARQLTYRKGDSESTPRYSPDGSYIGFISSRSPDDAEAEDVPDRLWLLPRAGGEARPIEGVEGSVTDYAFSPDGKRIALIVLDAKPKLDDEQKDRPQPIVIDRYLFKRDGTGFLDNRRERLWLYDIASGKTERLTDGDFDEALPAWSPDGTRVAFVSRRLKDAERSPDYNLWLAHVDRPGKSPLQLTRYEGADGEGDFGAYPAWSPDGRTIAYTRGGDPKLIWYATNEIATVAADGSDERGLTRSLDRNVTDPFWSADGKSISFIVEEDGVQKLASIPAGGGSVSYTLTGDFVLADPAASANGRLAMRVGKLSAPDEIYALDKGQLRPLTSHNAALVADLDLGKVERIAFASKDGTEIRGFLQTPPGYRKGQRVPTMLMIHGGPTAQYDMGFDMEREAIAARGYAVVFVNPRGSTGRGTEFANAINAAWGSVDVEDVLAGVDLAVTRGIADPDKLVIGGWSYGGMLTNYVIASDQRFKAAVSGASIGNVLAGYGTDHYVYEYDVEMGYPWENQEAWERISYPFLQNQRIVTPTLFMVGGSDVNVPTLASEQMYQALRSRGIETKLVIYPDQAHGISRPSFITDRLTRWLSWYDAHVK